MDATVKLGCIACINLGHITPFEVDESQTVTHHIFGKTKPNAHFMVLPLCHRHHDRYGVDGLHYNKKRWEYQHGSQEQLWHKVVRYVYDDKPEYLDGIFEVWD
jgi:hypothetical protein